MRLPDVLNLGAPIGVGATAEVYDHGPHVLKLYAAGASRESVAREASVLEILERAGIAAPRPRGIIEIGGRWGIVMTRANGRPFAETMTSDPATVPAHIEAMVTHQRALHAVPGHGLPLLAERLAARIACASTLSDGDRKRLGARLADMPSGDRLCHGDFHPFNVIGTPEAAVVIDWVDASSGSPVADVCRSYLLMLLRAPELAEMYIGRYCARSGDRRQDVKDWLPVIAAARLSENIGADEADQLLAIARRG